MKTIKLNVKGMHCKSCEMLVQDDLEELNGIKKIEVSHAKGFVNVEFDESKINIDKIKDIIEKRDYKVN